MWSNIVMVDLHSPKNRCIGFFKCSHHPFSVTNFSVHALHFVVLGLMVGEAKIELRLVEMLEWSLQVRSFLVLGGVRLT